MTDERTYRDTELWSTFDLRRNEPIPTFPIEWFSYGLSQQIANGVRCATRADTNVMRNGQAGLPQGYHMKVRAWRARAVAPRVLLQSEVWWYWCSQVSVTFTVNHKQMAEWTLDELLRAPGRGMRRDSMESPGRFDPPVDIHGGHSYVVRFQPERHASAELEHAIRTSVSDNPMNAVVDPKDWTPIHLRCYLRGLLHVPVC